MKTARKKKPFSFDTIADFDKHIDKSIPRYDELTSIIRGLAEYFIIPETSVVDLGCSTGKLITSLADKYPETDFVGLDKSPNLLPNGDPELRNLAFSEADITELDSYLGDSYKPASVFLSIFTLQFVNPIKRKEVLRLIYRELATGGAFIFTEKVYSNDPKFQDIFTSLYYEYKEKNGFTTEDILSKEKDLRRILKPSTVETNERLLRNAGFSRVEPFYRLYNFVGWICVK